MTSIITLKELISGALGCLLIGYVLGIITMLYFISKEGK